MLKEVFIVCGVLSVVICFFIIMDIWLQYFVLFMQWVVMKMVVFLFVVLQIIFQNCCCVIGFMLLVGLFRKMIVGWCRMVMEKASFCCYFSGILDIRLFVNFDMLSFLISWLVFCCICLWGSLQILLQKWMFFCIFRFLQSENFWFMQLMWCLICLGLWQILQLVIIVLFFVGCDSLVSMCMAVVLFVLLVLRKLKIFFLFILKEMVFIVVKLLNCLVRLLVVMVWFIFGFFL